MSGYTSYPEGDNYWGNQQQQGSYNFDTSNADFNTQLDFQSFESFDTSGNGPQQQQQQQTSFQYTSQQDTMYSTNPYLNPSGQSYKGEIFNPANAPVPQGYGGSGTGTSDFEDEPPLLEELGINPEHIVQKTLSVLNPFRETEASVLQDADLAGPLVFCLAFGGFLLLSGKVHFSYIYGIGVLGCIAMYALLNLMTIDGTSLGTVVSVLGYCLLPMVAVSGVNVIISLQGLLGLVLTGLAIAWCSLSASKLLVSSLGMQHQQLLLAYPCALLYGVFALITIF